MLKKNNLIYHSLMNPGTDPAIAFHHCTVAQSHPNPPTTSISARPISAHLISACIISSRLVSSRLIVLHLIASRLIASSLLIRFRATSDPASPVLPQLITPLQPSPSPLLLVVGQLFEKVGQLLPQIITKSTAGSGAGRCEDNCNDNSTVLPRRYCFGVDGSR
jgi:hypothetical protein